MSSVKCCSSTACFHNFLLVKNVVPAPPPHFNPVVPDDGEQICLVSLEVTNHQRLLSRSLLSLCKNLRLVKVHPEVEENPLLSDVSPIN